MSNEKMYTVKVTIKTVGDKINFHFTVDCGRHGTDESLAEYTFDTHRILEIFAKADVTDEELA